MQLIEEGLLKNHDIWRRFLDFRAKLEAFSKVKTLLKKAKARSFEALAEATGRVLSTVNKVDARGFVTHCGYGTPRALSL